MKLIFALAFGTCNKPSCVNNFCSLVRRIAACIQYTDESRAAYEFKLANYSLPVRTRISPIDEEILMHGNASLDVVYL